MSAAFLGRRVRLAAIGLAIVLCGRIAGAAIVSQVVTPRRSESARVALERTLPPMRGDRLHVALVEITYAPGGFSAPHTHRCPVVGHVVSGALRTRVAGGAERIYHAGESFQEDADQPHVVSANASDAVPVTFLAYFVCDGDGPRSVALTRDIPR